MALAVEAMAGVLRAAAATALAALAAATEAERKVEAKREAS